MQKQYNKKQQQAEQILQEGGFEQTELLQEFCERLCAAPFIKKPDTITLWLELWPLFDEQQRRHLTSLPDPCLKHVESRMGKDRRAENLRAGVKRLIRQDQFLTLEGLRLYPHALCRAAEAIGPISDEMWEELVGQVQEHRFWQIGWELSEEEFWEAAELLFDYRELPQSVLDHLDLDRPREKAPLEEFKQSLRHYLMRGRIEKIRLSTYEMLRCHSETGLEVGLNK